MNPKFQMPEGLIYVPRFVKQESDLEYGSVVTHENYNEKLNLNTTQGDYNTEVLRLLFTEERPDKVYHIRYLDKVIKDEVDRIDAELDNKQQQIDKNKEDIETNRKDIATFNQKIVDIIEGVVKVGHAVKADEIAGVHDVPNHYYYGTDYDGNVGFHEVPDAIYARDMSGTAAEVQGIFFTPRQDSVDESMLTEAVREKINREFTPITNYEQLDHRPKLNNVELIGNITLDQIGAQPKGNYLTSVPDTYALKTYVDNKVSPYLLASTASSTYATKTSLSTLESTVTTNKNYAEGRYARVCINSFSGTPKLVTY